MRLDKKWSIEQLGEHIRTNSNDTYSMAVVLAALHKKLYGKFPRFGLSGCQAECADSIVEYLPKRIINDPTEC